MFRFFPIRPNQRARRSVFGAWLCLMLSAAGAQATTIDILLVYDRTATAWVADNGGMGLFSQDAVNRMNQAMSNSDVDLSFRLVHAMSVDYTTTSDSSTPLSSDLQALQAGDGPFAPVHAARDTYGADIVALLVDHGSASGYVGQAYVLTSWFGIDDYAYSVNAVRAVDISQTLTHEVAHILGAAHAKTQTQQPGPNTFLSDPAAPYSAGWYFDGTDGVSYHTVMAYNYNAGRFFTAAPLFSTPLVSSQGTPAGDAAHGDNARLLRLTKDLSAAYRDSWIPPEPTGALDLDGDGTAGALTDGLLLIRAFFGFDGAGLTAGAVGEGCTRCDAAAIAARIDDNLADLDVDGNGIGDALTDGLLVMRFLFGFSGAALTDGAVGEGCTRCTAQAIADHCSALSP